MIHHPNLATTTHLMCRSRIVNQVVHRGGERSNVAYLECDPGLIVDKFAAPSSPRSNNRNLEEEALHD